ncbi:MAG: dihydroneopterin triphosphate diphosphatase [Gammaproteobacteria bacterium]
MSAEQERLKRPESVLVVVYTAVGEVLMLERSQPEGFWQSVTGSLEWGESAAKAAARELEEETGLRGFEIVNREESRSFPILPQWRERYSADVTTNLEHVFTVQLLGRVGISLNAGEHLEHRWLHRDDAAELAGSWTNRDAILKYVPGGADLP